MTVQQPCSQIEAALMLTLTMQKPKAAGEKKPKTTKPKVTLSWQAAQDILAVDRALKHLVLCTSNALSDMRKGWRWRTRKMPCVRPGVP